MTDLHIFADAVYNLDKNKAVSGWGFLRHLHH